VEEVLELAIDDSEAGSTGRLTSMSRFLSQRIDAITVKA